VLDDFDTLSFAEKAVEYQPDNPRYLQTLGALQMRTFQYPLAADSLLEASRLRPDDPAIRRQAIVAIERLLEIDPENEVARRELDQLRDAAAESTP
jgi:Flp pilus assembly protein TadD